MRCRICGRTGSLELMSFEDEDGYVYEDFIDLCIYCVEVAEERNKKRAEWNYYHPGESCPPEELES